MFLSKPSEADALISFPEMRYYSLNSFPKLQAKKKKKKKKQLGQICYSHLNTSG